MAFVTMAMVFFLWNFWFYSVCRGLWVWYSIELLFIFILLFLSRCANKLARLTVLSSSGHMVKVRRETAEWAENNRTWPWPIHIHQLPVFDFRCCVCTLEGICYKFLKSSGGRSTIGVFVRLNDVQGFRYVRRIRQERSTNRWYP
jgi:hypothetical protein